MANSLFCYPIISEKVPGAPSSLNEDILLVVSVKICLASVKAVVISLVDGSVSEMMSAISE